MNIDYCLILAAGFGTRMGVIGKQLPKVLWPIFERPMLELEIEYARSLGIKKIYINLHHQHAQIMEHFKPLSLRYYDVTFIHEPEILDIGGAIHNIAAQKEVAYEGNLLVINSDQFLMLGQEAILKGLESLKKNPVVLFPIEVGGSKGYNRLEISRGLLKGITADQGEGKGMLTYSGVSLVHLNRLSPTTGPSPFFESVANYKKWHVSVMDAGAKDSQEYWDFGSKERYAQSLFRFMDQGPRSTRPGSFQDFCLKQKAFIPSKYHSHLMSYGTVKSKNILNLGNHTLQNVPPTCHWAIILKGTKANLRESGIYFEETFEKMDDEFLKIG